MNSQALYWLTPADCFPTHDGAFLHSVSVCSMFINCSESVRIEFTHSCLAEFLQQWWLVLLSSFCTSKIFFSFVLMVLFCLLDSASVQDEFFNEMTNQFTHIRREQFLPECQPCNGVHVHLQVIESLDVVELHIFFCSCHFLGCLQ